LTFNRRKISLQQLLKRNGGGTRLVSRRNVGGRSRGPDTERGDALTRGRKEGALFSYGEKRRVRGKSTGKKKDRALGGKELKRLLGTGGCKPESHNVFNHIQSRMRPSGGRGGNNEAAAHSEKVREGSKLGKSDKRGGEGIWKVRNKGGGGMAKKPPLFLKN